MVQTILIGTGDVGVSYVLTITQLSLGQEDIIALWKSIPALSLETTNTVQYKDITQGVTVICAV